MRWRDRRRDYSKWRRKFIWYPTVIENKTVWLEFAETRIVYNLYSRGHEEWRLINRKEKK